MFIKSLIILVCFTSFSCKTGFDYLKIGSNISNGQTDVFIDTAIEIRFTMDVDETSVNDDTVYATRGEGSDECNPEDRIEAETTMDGPRLVSIRPINPLDSLTRYSACLNDVKFKDGSQSGRRPVVTFTTEDREPPAVESVSPTNGATDVAINTSIQAVFNEAMDPLTINGDTFTVTGITPIDGTVTYDQVTYTAIFTPLLNLNSFQPYTATISGDVQDLAGNEMGGDYVWSFTTSDVEAPTVVSTSPLGGEIDVAIDTIVTATFDKDMDPLTCDTTSFSVSLAGSGIAGTVQCVGDTATFTPDSNLSYGVTYTGRITTDVADIHGNHLVAPYSWTFTTAAAYWAKTYGGINDDNDNFGFQTRYGRYIIGGVSDSFGFPSRILVLNLLSDGTPDWQKAFHAGTTSVVIWSIEPTSDGGCIIAGDGTNLGGGDDDAWIIKLGPNGDTDWERSYGGIDIDSAWSVQQTLDGGYIVLGDTSSFTAQNTDLWILKLTSDGSVTWEKLYGGANWEYPAAIRQTSDGGYLVLGRTTSFGAVVLDYWVLKLNAAGAVVWEKLIGGGDSDYPWSASETPDGGYILAGATRSYGAGSYDFWVMKLDSTGTIVWQKTYGDWPEETAEWIETTSDGGYITAGLARISGSGYFWVLKLNADGSINWQKIYGDGAGTEHAHSIQQTFDGGYVIVGHTNSYGADPSNFWVVKTDSNGDIGGSCAAIGTTAIVPLDSTATAIDTSGTVADTTATVTATSATVTDTTAATETQCSAFP